jgi:Holliday junction resolvase RusA-like endonuclease
MTSEKFSCKSMTIEIDPMGAPRQSRRDKWKPSIAVIRYRIFRDEMRRRILTLPVPLILVFTIAMPTSWSEKKKKEMDGKPHTQVPDTDNLTKAVLDSIYDQDSHIHDIHAQKIWGRKGSIFISESAYRNLRS